MLGAEALRKVRHRMWRAGELRDIGSAELRNCEASYIPQPPLSFITRVLRVTWAAPGGVSAYREGEVACTPKHVGGRTANSYWSARLQHPIQDMKKCARRPGISHQMVTRQEVGIHYARTNRVRKYTSTIESRCDKLVAVFFNSNHSTHHFQASSTN